MNPGHHIHLPDKRPRIKITRRYRLTFTDENTLYALWSMRMSRLKAWILGVVVLTGVVCIVAGVIVATPLRSLLPGYLGAEQRQTHIINNMRVDSMATAVDIGNAYVSNIIAILNDDLDTVAPGATGTDAVADTLIEASATERDFIRKWEERERYNLRVLTPLATEGMVFSTPVSSAMIDTLYTHPTKRLVFTPRRNAPISAIYSGTVIDYGYSPDEGISITIQHPNDFISHYSGMSEAFVAKGDRIRSGQNIGLVSSVSPVPGRKAALEMWHKGSSINPLDYIDF